MLDFPITCEPIAADEDPVTEVLYLRKEKAFIHTLNKLLPQLHGDIHRQTSHCLGLYQSLSTSVRRSVISHPLFHHWRLNLIRLLKKGNRAEIEESLQELSHFLIIPALRCGIWEGESLYVKTNARGEIRFPGHPYHIDLHLQSQSQGDLAVCTVREGMLSIAHGSCNYQFALANLLTGNIHNDLLHQRKVIKNTNIEIDASDPYIQSALKHMNDQDPVPPYPKRDVEAVPVIHDELLETYNSAVALIERAWPELKSEMDGHVRLVVPFSSELMEGWTDKQFLGAIFIRALPGNILFAVEHLVHEASHTRLYAIQTLTPLDTNAPTDLFPSSLRKDLRPASGIYHAAFVQGRILECLLHIRHQTGQSQYAQRVTEILPQFEASLDTLRNEVKLTIEGKNLLEELALRVQAANSIQAL
jgi:HEXXH motif-containing protein